MKTDTINMLHAEKKPKNLASRLTFLLVLSILVLLSGNSVYAHCDAYDGPVIVDAEKALEFKNVNLVLKWINQDQEAVIVQLFNKTIAMQNQDQEIYDILKQYFLETLVRLHRETEGASYTGIKPAGTTKKIVRLSDNALHDNDIDTLISKLNNHIAHTVKEKYQKVAELVKYKDETVEQGRAYVKAYVDYTHTIEALHDILEHGSGHAH